MDSRDFWVELDGHEDLDEEVAEDLLKAKALVLEVAGLYSKGCERQVQRDTGQRISFAFGMRSTGLSLEGGSFTGYVCDVDMEDWPGDLGFDDWFDKLMRAYDVEVYD
jgi:hypothetical protein